MHILDWQSLTPDQTFCYINEKYITESRPFTFEAKFWPSVPAKELDAPKKMKPARCSGHLLPCIWVHRGCFERSLSPVLKKLQIFLKAAFFWSSDLLVSKKIWWCVSGVGDAGALENTNEALEARHNKAIIIQWFPINRYFSSLKPPSYSTNFRSYFSASTFHILSLCLLSFEAWTGAAGMNHVRSWVGVSCDSKGRFDTRYGQYVWLTTTCRPAKGVTHGPVDCVCAACDS